ncbi:7673_t:CDS:2, partial [Gigaspora margarita]
TDRPDHLQVIIKRLMQPIRNNYGKVVQAEWPDNFEVKLNFPSAIKTDVNDVIVKMEGDTSILTINKAQKILKLKVVDNK